jgi:hypothetical protein
MARPYMGGTKPNVKSCNVAETTYNLIEGDSNKIIMVGADGITINLPAPRAGYAFSFVVQADGSTANCTIVTPSGALRGHVYSNDLDGSDGATSGSSSVTTMNLVHGSVKQGDQVEMVCDGTDYYFRGYVSNVGAITLA